MKLALLSVGILIVGLFLGQSMGYYKGYTDHQAQPTVEPVITYRYIAAHYDNLWKPDERKQLQKDLEMGGSLGYELAYMQDLKGPSSLYRTLIILRRAEKGNE